MTYKTNWRDKLAHTLATWVLTQIATQRYCDWITGLKNTGLTNLENNLFAKSTGSKVYEAPEVTRITVAITGRGLEKWNLENVELHFQDEGRTLKVFANEQEKI